MTDRTATLTREAPAPPRAPEPPPEPGGLSITEMGRAVYRFFYNKKVGLFLILAMTVLTLLGVLFPQVSAELRADPQAYASWLEQVRPRYGGWTTPLSVLGVFSMFSSPAFKIVVIALVLSILACTTHRIPLLWKQATEPHLHVTEGFFSHARLRADITVAAPPEQAAEQVRDALRAKRFRVLDDPKGPEVTIFGDRHRFAPLGTALAHVAFVLILLGVLISANTGFRDNEFAVAVGSTRDVGHGTSLQVELLGFADTYHPDGRPKDYVSDVVLYDNGREVARQEVRVNTPLRYDGVKFNQAYFGVAADIAVTDATGAELFRQGVPLDRTTGDERHVFGRVELPDSDLVLYVIEPASGQVDPQIGPGQVQVEVYRQSSQEPIATDIATQGAAADLGEVTVTFERSRKFTGLMVSRDPGAPWVWAGSILFILGTYFTMYLRHHRVWVRVHPDPDGHPDRSFVRLGCPDRLNISFEPKFRHLVRTLEGTGTPEKQRIS
ncbi:MAG TPA: cytochrome c biogenesis protein ResB [Intrasporangiaceae bacterium]|nr:cytochrome c biogenesis protein ResB [Intrasporangiaceae bacterium]